MDEHENSNVTYYLIPANVSAEFEFFEGFGWKELKYVGFALLLGALLFFLSGLIVSTERVEKDKLSIEKTIGLKNDSNTIIQGNFVIYKKEVVPLPARIFMVLIPTAAAFFFVRRDPATKTSLIATVRYSRNFSKKQKRYLYKYGSGTEE